MKKIFKYACTIAVTALFTFQSVFAASIKKEFEVETKDSQLIKATAYYPKTKQTTYPTVVLLHSIGYSSSQWGDLPKKLIESGYAVLAIDLRGHGKSVYDAKFRKKSWVYFKNETFIKYPDDVIAIIKEVKNATKKLSFNDWAIIGGDIGANTAVTVAKKSQVKPRALVLLSPSLSFKGVYIPVDMAELGSIPIYTVASEKDNYSISEQKKLTKFAQGEFAINNVPSGGMGMMLIKTNPEITTSIIEWLDKKFK